MGGPVQCVRRVGLGRASRWPPRSARPVPSPVPLDDGLEVESRVTTGVPGLDRVLGGGLVPGSVVLLAGASRHREVHAPPACWRTSAGTVPPACWLRARSPARRSHGAHGGWGSMPPASGSHPAASWGRSCRRDGLSGRSRSPSTPSRPSATRRVPRRSGVCRRCRMCVDALLGLAKEHGVTVIVAGHVTKDGDLAGPRALEHAVDVVLSFDGDVRSGLRVLAGGKNRFGAEGETAWFEMTSSGLLEIDPTDLLVSGETVAGSAVALPQVGRGGPWPSTSRRSWGARRPRSASGDGARRAPVPAGRGGARSVRRGSARSCGALRSRHRGRQGGRSCL